ncbi:hypothetical protein H7J07_06775 [Mycobacterium koreense]|uniref:Uncharacterized protein n=1 Tax=Mycolicibacillus koreensis TaxID=1069220 RepID=A0A7I7SJQ5_9MYCO|nr:hypothetical protein [Mycolicibacillus koreensis]MCV7247923.1 hypothetical protein [Mycolicibacillus koreensis]OSC24504.1 hypothetical protein B8W67_19520 [Mycolicibacillus koreensis]BBY56166.1 hypothetical protein MKOR_34170 [Mycolicibacillus koreensis]
MSSFLRAEFTDIDPTWSLDDTDLCLRILESTVNPNTSIRALRDHWGDHDRDPITAAAFYLSSRFPVTTTVESVPQTTPVEVLRPWIDDAAGRPLDDLETTIVCVLAGFTIRHLDGTPTVDIPPFLIESERARRAGWRTPFGNPESYWPTRPRITQQKVDEVLVDMSDLSTGGVMNLAPSHFLHRRRELESVSVERIRELVDCLITRLPAVTEITDQDSVKDHHVSEWVTMRHPEIGHVGVGELVIAAAVAGYQIAVCDSGARTHDDLYIGVPNLFVDLYEHASSVHVRAPARSAA